MIAIKDLINELGGGRSITLGAVLVVCSYVAASRYVDSVEERLEALNREVSILKEAKIRFDAFESLGDRFVRRDGAELIRRIEKIENELDDK